MIKFLSPECESTPSLSRTILTASSGGGRVLDNSGNMVQTKDQKTSRIAKAYINNMKKNMPVAVIIGELAKFRRFTRCFNILTKHLFRPRK